MLLRRRRCLLLLLVVLLLVYLIDLSLWLADSVLVVLDLLVHVHTLQEIDARHFVRSEDRGDGSRRLSLKRDGLKRCNGVSGRVQIFKMFANTSCLIVLLFGCFGSCL